MKQKEQIKPLTEVQATKVAWCLLVEELIAQGVLNPKGLLERIDEVSWLDDSDELDFFRRTVQE
ncbi:hypothetical protein [Psychrobacter lutiphocae]|uniref:hypothetical protein n=1 Tax=Psychrobacter lutiphocae TaxID=540500 RepID=UPI00037906B6|nr:hypothetical protein [Psychrobacter lutiphocae]